MCLDVRKGPISQDFQAQLLQKTKAVGLQMPNTLLDYTEHLHMYQESGSVVCCWLFNVNAGREAGILKCWS